MNNVKFLQKLVKDLKALIGNEDFGELLIQPKNGDFFGTKPRRMCCGT